LHRGDFDGAADKLEKAQKAAEKLKPIVEAEPSLRMGGSYSNSLEEVCSLRAADIFNVIPPLSWLLVISVAG